MKVSLKKYADNLALELRDAIQMLEVVDFDKNTDPAFKRVWRHAISRMEKAVHRYEKIKP